MKKILKSFAVVALACLSFMSKAQAIELNCWKNTGLPTKLNADEAVLKVPDVIGAIDLRGVKALTLDCSSANPNCLYYTDGDTRVEGLPDANVVCNGICDGLLLTDAACFFCPMPFKASDAMLRLTPRRDDGEEETTFNQPCHETFLLPFDADFVIPADANGPMPDGWLRVSQYEGFGNDILLFRESDANHLSANIPYIAEFAYAAYSTQILFCGQNKTVGISDIAFAGEKPFCFAGMTFSQNERPGYFRYYRGQEPYFIYTGDARPMEPFRCFIVDTDLLNEYAQSGEEENGNSDSKVPQGVGRVLEYTIFGMPTTIQTHNAQVSSDRCYDLMGRPVKGSGKNRGIYIVNGIKVVK